jgi:site-specific recombinase XerD
MSIEPSNAVEMYLSDRTSELSENSIDSYRKRLNAFIRWCDQNEIERLSDVEGIDLHRFKVDQQQQIAHSTMVNRLHALRALLQWAGRIEIVDDTLYEKVVVPKDDSSRSRAMDSDTASDILSYLRRFEYASRDHIVMELFWTTAMRLGELRSIDLDDYHSDPSDADGPYISVRHRPDRDTPLKNGSDGERTVSIRPNTQPIIGDYIEHNRIEVRDDYGREPLLTTRNGRPGETTIRNTVYTWTRPCAVGKGCPHDRDPESCEAAPKTVEAFRCPSVYRPHDIRRGGITHHLKNDIPIPMVSDRCDVSPDILEEHYDQRSELEKMEQRRAYLDNI